MSLRTFVREDSDTWTAGNVRNYLKTSKHMHEDFFREAFAWSQKDLQDAIRRADRALRSAGITPGETLAPIRVDKATGNLTPGAVKRINAESSLTTGSRNFDGLFSLPHERNKTEAPAWFEEDLKPNFRQQIDNYETPTLIQKFFQLAREKLKWGFKATVENDEDEEMESPADDDDEGAEDDGDEEMESTEQSLQSQQKTEKSTQPTSLSGSQRKSSESQEPLPRRGIQNIPPNDDRFSAATQRYRLPLDEVEAHVGWIVMSEDGRFVLEKEFRSLRTWFTTPDLWQYNYTGMRNSLYLAADSNNKVYWFEDYSRDPWVAKDSYAIAGAIERMYRKGEICLFVATEIGHVRALSNEQRSKSLQVFWSSK